MTKLDSKIHNRAATGAAYDLTIKVGTPIAQETYSDNILVRQTPQGAEFLAVCFSVEEGTSPICLYRYGVPGRCDVYSFDWVPGNGCGVGDRVRYFSDQYLPLASAVTMAARDLNKKAVVKMLVEACQKPEVYWSTRVLVDHLLPILAPKSVALRECAECLRKIHEARRKAREKR